MTSLSRFRSLRWQLPLSYAAIALLAVLALGIALLSALRAFYREQELAYLKGNAIAIADEIAPLLMDGERPLLQTQIAQFSFLTQTRIEALDKDGQTVLVDSDELDSFMPAISVNPNQDRVMVDEVTTVIEEERENEDGAISSQRVVTRTSQLSAQGSLYGFTLGETQTAVGERSTLAVKMSIIDEFGNEIGLVRLSEGPAYGNVILRDVAQKWAVAGAIAILLAALVGWLISRRLTQPLLTLTAVTEQMADGDLTARTDVRQKNELGALGQSFNQMAEQVENTVTALRQFAADAAHELNTPLTALQTDLQLLADNADPTQQQRAQRAESQAARLQSLADSLLDLSRLEAEPMVGKRPLLNLNQLLQIVAEPVASQAEQAGLEFGLDLPETAIFVHGDDGRLQQAIGNLLENSLKFTSSPGNVWLALEVEGETAVVTVRDSGIGIPPEDLPKLFGRFHRGVNTANYAGNGLGLAIVKAIIINHDGHVTIENENKGCKAQIRLPAASLSRS
ncbi:MAG: HAMP domain-containing histidine kinase [Chloroflexi bacterium]|nr:HAMP domain-containing histidine kinase [Chloroflexota bacterium]